MQCILIMFTLSRMLVCTSPLHQPVPLDLQKPSHVLFHRGFKFLFQNKSDFEKLPVEQIQFVVSLMKPSSRSAALSISITICHTRIVTAFSVAAPNDPYAPQTAIVLCLCRFQISYSS